MFPLKCPFFGHGFPPAMALDAAVGVRLEGVQVVSQGASEEHRLLEDGFMDPPAKFRRKSGKSLVNLMKMLGTNYYSIFLGGLLCASTRLSCGWQTVCSPLASHLAI